MDARSRMDREIKTLQHELKTQGDPREPQQRRVGKTREANGEIL